VHGERWSEMDLKYVPFTQAIVSVVAPPPRRGSPSLM
jgi:hypothetical protein